jgi:hypothetical protein
MYYYLLLKTRHVIEHIKHLWAIAYENGNKEVTEKILLENVIISVPT